MGKAAELIEQLVESVSRYAGIWKASNGRWYLDLAHREYGDYEDATTYGPFSSERAADKYMSSNFSNPGGLDVDDSGTQPPPKRSPNRDPVVKPGRGGGSSGSPFGRF